MKQDIWRYVLVLILIFLFILFIKKVLDNIPSKSITIHKLPEKTEIKFLLFKEVLNHNLNYQDYLKLLKIAYAESCLNHFNDGEILRGINKKDKGLFQINEDHHKVDDSLEENIKYAIKLYIQKGTKPWIYSKENWKKDINNLKKMCNDE